MSKKKEVKEVEEKEEVKVEKPDHCQSCGGRGWQEPEVKCLECNGGKV